MRVDLDAIQNTTAPHWLPLKATIAIPTVSNFAWGKVTDRSVTLLTTVQVVALQRLLNLQRDRSQVLCNPVRHSQPLQPFGSIRLAIKNFTILAERVAEEMPVQINLPLDILHADANRNLKQEVDLMKGNEK
jgi:hypothetical protein